MKLIIAESSNSTVAICATISFWDDFMLLDCLSFPLTIAFWMKFFKIFDDETVCSNSELNVIVLGASRKAVINTAWHGGFQSN